MMARYANRQKRKKNRRVKKGRVQAARRMLVRTGKVKPQTEYIEEINSIARRVVREGAALDADYRLNLHMRTLHSIHAAGYLGPHPDSPYRAD